MNLIRRLILALALSAGIAPAFAQVPPPVPALPDTERRTSYAISGTTCACAVNFALYGDGTDYQNWVEVFIDGVRYDFNDATHGWTITSPTGPLSSHARPITDAVLTFNAVQTGTVQIVGARRPRRTAQFAENQGVSARNLNQVFTDIISQNREIWDKTNDMTGRGFFAPPGQTGAVVTGTLTGIISGPSSTTDGNIALWNGTSGAALKDGGGGAPSFSVIHPSSGQLLVGAGCNPAQAHSLWWVDQNLCSKADQVVITSNDPSSINRMTVTGTPANGTLTVTLKFSAQTFNIPVTVTNAMTTTQVAAAIAAAVQAAGVAVYNPVAGAQGEILYITNVANVVAYNANSTVATTIAYTAGTTALTLTFQAGQATPATDYALATQWDNNPVLVLARNTGVAPPANSVLAGIQFSGTQSVNPSTVSAQYGNFYVQVLNSTTGALSSRFALVTPDINNVANQGLYIGAGAYTVGTTDKGVDTFNAKQLWIDSAYEIFKSSNTFRLDTLATGHPFVFVSTGGYGFGLTPSAAGMEVGSPVSSLGGSTLPTSGSGWTLQGGGAPASYCFNWTASSYLDCQLLGLSFDFKPSNSSTSGVKISANVMRPDGDNVTTLGDGTHNWSTVFAKAISGLTTPLSVPQGGTGIASGISGGVPYYSGSTTIASSAALTSTEVMLGGGAGGAPTTLAGCTGSNSSVVCTSSVSGFPNSLIQNTTSDANSAAFVFKKSRSGGNTNSGDSILDFQALPFANAGYQTNGRMQFLQTGASSGSNVPTKYVLSTSNAAGQINQTWTFDSAGHQSIVQATAPTITAGCTGAGSAITGNDTYGTVTGSTAAVTTCTITFGTAYAATPHCVAVGLTSPLTGAITPATGTLVVNFASTANYKFTYHCFGA